MNTIIEASFFSENKFSNTSYKIVRIAFALLATLDFQFFNVNLYALLFINKTGRTDNIKCDKHQLNVEQG
jgi:hypothetical protein